MTDDKSRRYLVFLLFNVILAGMALVMTIVNIFSSQYILGIATVTFALLCLINIIYLKVKKEQTLFISILFEIDVFVLFSYFIISGTPDGFSAIWILLIPSLSYIIFGLKNGLIVSLIFFAELIFFFWIPFGKSLLQYEYSTTFMLRFPFIYITLMSMGLYIEFIRSLLSNRVLDREKRYRFASRHDQLTGVYNRHAFYEEITSIIQNEDLKNCPFSLILIDVDNFKGLNDTYGHTVGDEALCNLSKIITNNTCNHCMTCRWGGDEFLVFMHCSHSSTAIADIIRKSVEHNVTSNVKYTISIGICSSDTLTQEQIPDIIKYADRALYKSKQHGKNQVTEIVLPKK